MGGCEAIGRDATVPWMGAVLRLRISLADRAGALAQVATVIGLHGGNIVSIDVHRSGVDGAIDDLVVEFTDDPELGDLSHDLSTDAAATLLSHRRTVAVDPVAAPLRTLLRYLEGSADSTAVTEGIAELCPGTVAEVVGRDLAAQNEVGRLAVDARTPQMRRTGAVPGGLEDRVTGEVWLLAVPDTGYASGDRVVFVAHPDATEFTRTEVERIVALVEVHHQLGNLTPP